VQHTHTHTHTHTRTHARTHAHAPTPPESKAHTSRAAEEDGGVDLGAARVGTDAAGIRDLWGEDRYLPLAVAAARRESLRATQPVPLTDVHGAARPGREGQLMFDWGRGWLQQADGGAAARQARLRQMIDERDAREAALPPREEMMRRIAEQAAERRRRRGAAAREL
jgi:hypothetical protein